MENMAALSRSNRIAYSSPDVTRYYGSFDVLFEAERILLEYLRPKLQNSRILDLGIGGGRTTKHLLEISSKYVGLDYAPEAVKIASSKFPEARIAVGDARDLAEFDAETFDFVLFSFNGLDAVSNNGRIQALREINRVLKTGGTFMFSSHNRDYRYFHKLPWQRKIEFNLKFFHFLLYSFYHLPKHLRMKKREVFTDTYAVINDSDHRYSLLMYYISIDKQIRQLESNGFSLVEAYSADGKLVACVEDSPWVYYLATKANLSDRISIQSMPTKIIPLALLLAIVPLVAC